VLGLHCGKSEAEKCSAVVDISSIKPPKDVPAIPIANWRIVVDECRNFKVSHFFQRKDQMAEATCELLKQWRDKEIKTKFIRMDNAGENKLLEQRGKSKDWQFDWVVEYTPRDTPQHNHMAELGFAVLGNKGRALLIRANVPWKYRFHLYREAFKTTTDLDGLVMVTVNGKRATRFEHMF